jgi:hypothetical protein
MTRSATGGVGIGDAVSTTLRDLPVHILTEVAPCDDCPLAAVCRAGKLACSRFALYVENAGESQWREAPRQPSARIYGLLFGGARRPRSAP